MVAPGGLVYQRPVNRTARVDAPSTTKELDRVRVSIDRGRPYGEEKWVRETVKDLGLEHSVSPEGRPRKASQLATEATSYFLPDQFRLLLSSAAYVLVQTLRRTALRGTDMEKAQVGTIRLTARLLTSRGPLSARKPRRQLDLGHSIEAGTRCACPVPSRSFIPSGERSRPHPASCPVSHSPSSGRWSGSGFGWASVSSVGARPRAESDARS
jgi:hypothetical protein